MRIFYQFRNIHHSFYAQGNKLQTQRSVSERQMQNETGSPESKDKLDQSDSVPKKGVGTLNQQFGFSIGKGSN